MVTTPNKQKSWRTDKRTSGARGYTYKWQVARLEFLRANPLCVYCAQAGTVTAANVVDHIQPHQGDQVLFWDRSNWQPLCAKCHDTVKAEQEGRHAMKASFTPDGRVVW